jgi:hypothetical protein
MKFHPIPKLLITIISLLSFYAFTNINPQISVNNDNMITNDTIPEIVVSSAKADRYNIYLNHCNEIVKDTILQTGYLDFDTLRVPSIPVNKIYFGKPVIKSLQISKELANIIVMDTIWNFIEAPEYRSTWEYYILAKHPMPTKKIVEVDYSNKIIVSRQKEYTMKRSKPLPISDWDKYINNKSGRNSPTEQYF